MSEKSGLYYPNLMARIYLQVLEEVMGQSGVNALLNLAGLRELVDNYPRQTLTGASILPILAPLAGLWRRCMVRVAVAGWALERAEPRLPKGYRNLGRPPVWQIWLSRYCPRVPNSKLA